MQNKMDNIIHSISNVITNSSTELFITPTSAAVEAIRVLLVSLGLEPDAFSTKIAETNEYLERRKKVVLIKKSDNIEIPFSDLIDKIFEAKEFNH